MKTFKRIDLYAQLMLIAAFAIAEVFKRDETFLYGYLAVGLLQVISMGVHYTNNWHCLRGGRRYNYQRFVAVLFIVAAVSALVKLIMGVLYFLLFASPFMALYYTWICYREVFFYSKRPLELI